MKLSHKRAIKISLAILGGTIGLLLIAFLVGMTIATAIFGNDSGEQWAVAMIFAIVAPMLLFIGTAAAIIAIIVFWKDERRGHCSVCGYDLQGLYHATRCPECGSSTNA